MLEDIVLAVRDYLRENLTNPNDPNVAGDSWIFTAYHSHEPMYPMITVEGEIISTKHYRDLEDGLVLSEFIADVKVKVWSNTMKQRDELADDVVQLLLNAELGYTITTTSNREKSPNCRIVEFKVHFLEGGV
ncbi:hypothetical protein DRN72_02565 [Methanosarcinales archaeon]|nr:MAG: hypothetical protein DRN72_02565 [Methanosarcinales archaeon]